MRHMDFHSLEFTIFIGIMLLVVSSLIYAFWRQKKQVKALLDSLKVEKIDSSTWSISCGEKKVVLYYFAGSRSSSSYVSLSLSGDFSGQCLIRKENKFDKFSKSLGINKEAQVLDPEIGDKYYFECEDTDFVKLAMEKSGVKDILKEVLGAFSRIEIQGNVCSFVKSPGNLTSLKPQQLLDLSAKLIEFIQYIPRAVPSSTSLTVKTEVFESGKKMWTGFAFGLLFAGVLYLGYGGMDLYQPLSRWHVFLGSLWISVLLFLFLVPRAIDRLSHHATSAQTLLQVLGLGVPGLVICVWAATTLLNGFMDTSKPVDHAVRVVGKHFTTSSKSGNKYYLIVNPWEAGQSSVVFRVPYSDYSRIAVATPCIVETKKGTFSYEWICAYTCKKK